MTQTTNKYGIPEGLLTISAGFSGMKKVNFLLIGKMGSGKTTLSVTGPKPVYYYGLDRGGSIGIARLVEQGWLIRDVRFEDDDPFKPTAWMRFEEDFLKKVETGVFRNFGSVVFDSTTGLGNMAMNYVLAKAGRAGETPKTGEKGAGYEKSDYGQQKNYLKNLFYRALALPCTVIFTGHPATYEEEGTGKIYTGPMITGDLKTKIPQWFNEIYYVKSEKRSAGQEYRIVTQPDGTYDARSALAFGGMLAVEEPATIPPRSNVLPLMNLMRKAGLTIPEVIPPGYYDAVPAEVKSLVQPSNATLQPK